MALGVSHVLLFGSLLLATLVGWLIGRRHGCNPESQLFRMLMLGLLVARLGFVLVYAEYFRDQPWRAVDIRDGGFIASNLGKGISGYLTPVSIPVPQRLHQSWYDRLRLGSG